jgi:hypothetical protein
MIRTAEAVIDEHGNVRLLEPVEVAGARRALVTILDEEPTSLAHETAILSERSLRSTKNWKSYYFVCFTTFTIWKNRERSGDECRWVTLTDTLNRACIGFTRHPTANPPTL